MLNRPVEKKIREWLDQDTRALLVNGARQVGKTSSIRNALQDVPGYDFHEINFLEQPELAAAISKAGDAKTLLARLSLMTSAPLKKHQTIIFFDEVQECPELVTMIKFLVDDGSYRYVLSGSLLGVELSGIRSTPVGYLTILDMYPLTIREFYENIGIGDSTFSLVETSFREQQPMDEFINKRLLDLFHLYLIVGGMPAAVQAYINTNNIQRVSEIQKNIVRLYKEDFSKYDKKEKFLLTDIYDAIPAQLEEKNRRFIVSKIAGKINFDRVENKFLWLKNAGVVLPVYNVTEPMVPLKINEKRNLFKLFMSDTGLLMSYYPNTVKLKILNGEIDVNMGGIYENIVAQELIAHSYPLYYYNGKKIGEVDFLLEYNGNLLPLEVKSGKDYKKHPALSALWGIENYDISKAFVLCEGNVKNEDRITYLPLYMAMCIREAPIDNPIVPFDLTGLN